MILTVTPNTALDVTYPLDAFIPGEVHRVGSVHSRAGGKGINVSRVLHALGDHTWALGFAGGPDREQIEADLHASGIAHELVRTRQPTRRTVAVTTPQDATLLNEPGPGIEPTETTALLDTVERFLPSTDVLVCSGSLPPGVPDDHYAQLVRRARAHGVPSIVDTSGAALQATLSAGPTVVTPNLAELGELTGLTSPPAAAAAAVDAGARACAVSLGANGMCVHTTAGTWSAAPSTLLSGNPTGAGDAAAAAFAAGLRDGADWPRMTRDAVALSGAAVLAELAGDINVEHYTAERARVRIAEQDVY